MDEKKDVDDLFGPLNNRLYEIKAGRAKKRKLHPMHLIDPIHKSVGSISDSEALSNVDFAIAEINVINTLTEERLTRSFEPFERTDPEYGRPITQEKLDEYKFDFSKTLKEEVGEYLIELNNIKSELLNRLEFKQTSKSEKIKLDLPAEEIATLFRGLEEAKVLTGPGHSPLSRILAQTFTSKKSDHLSHNSIKNDLDQPTEKAIKNTTIMLRNVISALESLKK